ncbi:MULTISPECIES: hypothetical protein [unclassified Streptomyces]|uniref:hypothetical protein n=1 Tax=unclassified Streptomyces TaxID=2593676 RepID=UPI003369DB3D
MGEGDTRPPGQGGKTSLAAGYKIEIASVRAVLTPLEESVVAARKIKGDGKALADHIGNSADFDAYDAAEKMLSS